MFTITVTDETTGQQWSEQFSAVPTYDAELVLAGRKFRVTSRQHTVHQVTKPTTGHLQITVRPI